MMYNAKETYFLVRISPSLKWSEIIETFTMTMSKHSSHDFIYYTLIKITK